MIDGVQRSVAKSGSALLISQLALAAINIFLTAYVVRILSKEELATAALVDILYYIFLLAELGFMAVATQQAPSALISGVDRVRALGLIKAGLYYPFVLVLLLGVLTYAYAAQVSQVFLKTTDYTWAIQWLVLGSVALFWYYAMLQVAQIKQDYYLVARWNFISGILRHAFTIPAFWLFGFRGFVIGILISCVLPTIGISWSLRGFIFNRAPIAPFKATFQYGFPFYIRNILRFGYTYLDQILVGIFLAPSALATFNVAHRLRKHVHIAIESFQMPMGLRMAALRQEPAEVQDSFLQKSIRYTDILIIPAVILGAAASPWLMAMFGGSKYAADWPILALLILGQAGYALFNVYSAAIFARLQPWATLAIDGLNGGINYLLIPALIGGMQLYGIVIGQIIGFTAGIILGRWLLQKYAGMHHGAAGFRLILAPLLVASSIIILGQRIYLTWFSVPIYILIGCLVFVLWLGRRFTQDDWSQMRAFIPSPVLPVWLRVEKLLNRSLPSQ